MRKLTREDLRQISKKPKLEECEVPEWGGSVFLGAMTIDERLAFDAKYTDQNGKFKNVNDPEMIYELLSRGVLDSEGLTLFNPQDKDVIKEQSGMVMQRLFLKVLNINYLTQESLEVSKKKSEKVL